MKVYLKMKVNSSLSDYELFLITKGAITNRLHQS